MVILITVFERSRFALLPHFVRHYRRFGVDNFKFILHVPNSSERDSLSQLFGDLLNFLDVNWSEDIIAGPYDTFTCRRFQDELQSRLVSSFKWIVWADSDEFHQFPRGLDSLVSALDAEGSDFISGKLVDRVTADGSLVRIHPNVPIWQQFPYGCNITHDILKGNTRKVVLARSRLRISIGNHVCLDMARGSRIGPISVHHFKWDASVVDRLRYRTSSSWRQTKPWWIQSQRGLDAIGLDGRLSLPEHDVRFMGAPRGIP